MNKQIKKGDYIGVISSSGLLKFSNKEQIDESIMNANECGLNVKLGNYLYKNEKSKEELLKDKLSDFNKMINDDDVKMIIFSRGGQDSDELLDYLNYNLIKKTNKNFVGLSDLTSILNAIYAKTGLITFHGCVFKVFLKGNHKYNKDNFVNLFFNNNKIIDIKHNLKKINGGVANGTLIGGNLVTFCKLINTKYMPKVKNYILFFEECDEISKEELNNLVEKLYKNNILKNAKGIILGNYSIDNDYFECVFKKYVNNIPMIKCTDFGHCECNVFLPIGAEVELDADKQKVTILNNIFE